MYANIIVSLIYFILKVACCFSLDFNNICKLISTRLEALPFEYVYDI